ncbi:MAG: AAA family ATPase [Promethearchaeota archaeon]
MKKNTLLTLDSDLVNYAKRMKVNISELAENALKKKLIPVMSSGERMILNIESYLKEMEDMNYCFFLPFPIKKLELKNVGPISSLSANFSKGINIIKGDNGSGKTILLRAIAMAFDKFRPEREIMLKRDEKEGYLKISTYEHEPQLKFDEKNKKGTFKTGCLLLDDGVGRLNPEKYKPFIEKLKEKYPIQIIMTMTRKGIDIPNSKIIEINNNEKLKT